jgi:hypothetical protein
MSPFNIFASLSLATLLASCGQSSAPGETVESLAADPERLKELRQQCKLDRAKLGDELVQSRGRSDEPPLLRRW